MAGAGSAGPYSRGSSRGVSGATGVGVETRPSAIERRARPTGTRGLSSSTRLTGCRLPRPSARVSATNAASAGTARRVPAVSILGVGITRLAQVRVGCAAGAATPSARGRLRGACARVGGPSGSYAPSSTRGGANTTPNGVTSTGGPKATGRRGAHALAARACRRAVSHAASAHAARGLMRTTR